MFTVNLSLTRIKIDFVLITDRTGENALGLIAAGGVPEWRLVGLTEICVGVFVQMTLVRQVQVMAAAAAAEGRTIADTAKDGVTMVTICAWFKRFVELILEWEQKGLRAGHVVSTWNEGDAWVNEAPTLKILHDTFCRRLRRWVIQQLRLSLQSDIKSKSGTALFWAPYTLSNRSTDVSGQQTTTLWPRLTGPHLFLIFLHWCRSILTGDPPFVTVSAEYVLVNSHHRHSGALVVTANVENMRREIIFTGSIAQFPSLSTHFSESKVIFEFGWIVGVTLKNLWTGNDRVFCRKIANRAFYETFFLVCFSLSPTFVCRGSHGTGVTPFYQAMEQSGIKTSSHLPPAQDLLDTKKTPHAEISPQTPSSLRNVCLGGLSCSSWRTLDMSTVTLYVRFCVVP